MRIEDYLSCYHLSASRGICTSKFFNEVDDMGDYFAQNCTEIELGDYEEDGVAILMKEGGFLASVSYYKAIITRIIAYEKDGEVYKWMLSKADYEELQKEGLTPSYIVDGWIVDGEFSDKKDDIIKNLISSLELIRLMNSDEDALEECVDSEGDIG